MVFEDEYITVKEFASFMGISVGVMRYQCRTGFRNAVKHNRRWLVHYTELHPVFKKELHPVLKKVINPALKADVGSWDIKRIILLRNLFSRRDMLRGMDLLAEANLYYRLIDRHSRKGLSDNQAKKRASRLVSLPYFFLEECRKIYLKGEDEAIDMLRGMFEHCGHGREVVATNPNRRLYAVLKPNRRENIERIRQFLCSLTVGQLQYTLMTIPAELRERYPQEEA